MTGPGGMLKALTRTVIETAHGDQQEYAGSRLHHGWTLRHKDPRLGRATLSATGSTGGP